MAESNTPTIKLAGVQVGTSKYVDFYEGLGVSIDIDYNDLAKTSAITISGGTSGSTTGLDLDIRDYGALIGDPTATATALQDAVDDCNAGVGQRIVIPSPGNASDVWEFDDTILLRSGTWIYGGGIMGITNSAARLRYTGADATNAFETSGTSTSRVRFTGIDLRDSRVGATSGDGIHATTTNGFLLEHSLIANFAGRQAYLGNSSGTPDNYAVEYCWFGANNGGSCLYLDHTAENIMLRFIMGDSNTASNGFDSLIYIAQSGGTGWSNVVIEGIKCEGTKGRMVDIDSSYIGQVEIRGVHKGQGPASNSVIRNQSSNANVLISTIATTDSTQVLVEDTPSGQTWGGTAATRMLPKLELIHTGHGSQVFGQRAGKVTAVSSNTTLAPDHDVVVVTTGTTDKTITLPSAALRHGYVYTVKKVDTGIGAVVLTPAGGETIEGLSTWTLAENGQAATVVSDGSDWIVVHSSTPFLAPNLVTSPEIQNALSFDPETNILAVYDGGALVGVELA